MMYLSIQEFYDASSKHLLKQGKKSIKAPFNMPRSWSFDPPPAYFGANGLKCGLGIFIPRKQYSLHIEGQPFDLLLKMRPETFPRLNQSHISVGKELQRIHDRCPPSSWRTELSKLAKDFGLKPI